VQSLAGKVVAITGGARGIGRATAAAALGAGAMVSIGDVDADVTRGAAAELGNGCLGVELDVTDRASFAGFLDRVESQIGPLDVIVNNAGVLLMSRFADEDEKAANRMIDVNLRGVITGSRLGLQRMAPRGRGHIINLSSLAGKAAFPGAATYSATKFAIVGLSEAIRMEARPLGIEVSCVMPALVATDMALGLKTPPGIVTIKPEDVASAIIATIERPRFDVYVPRAFGVATVAMGALPRRVRESLSRLIGADQPLEVDAAARAAYVGRYVAAAPDGTGGPTSG
jgi:NADP-dependent 3-hydroxy acid dehydrogenase YdfG